MTRHNRRSSSEAIGRKARKGFSLIEAAIVLGVVGLVIGGIWGAASAVSYQYQKQRFFDGFLTIRGLTENYLSQSVGCVAGGLYVGMGGSFMKYSYPQFYPLLIPNEWKKEIRISRFITSMKPDDMQTQVVCDANNTRYYNVAVFFKSSSICTETYNYLKARGMLVGSNHTANQHRCGTSDVYFDVVYEIPRRS